MDKVWLKNYQEGVPAEINPDEYDSLVAMFAESCSRFSSKKAYTNLRHSMTYQELEHESLRLAVFLQNLNLKKGARVALMMPNILQYPVALYAVLRAGLTVVNVNPLYTATETAHQLNDSGAEVIIVLANFAKTVEEALSETKIKHVIVTELADMMPFFKRTIINAVVKYIKKMVPQWHLPAAVTFRQALAQYPVETFKPVLLGHSDTAFLQYTGGTTGIAKGAVLSHGNMVANILQAYSWIKPLGIDSSDIIVTALPLYHIFSLTANCLTFLKAGAENILITNPRDLPSFVKDIKSSGFTAITGVNTLFNALLNNSHFSDIDFSKLKLALSGGMSLQKSVAKKWHDMTHTRILEAYGLTETCPAVTINPMYLTDYNGSIGLPLPSTDVKFIDDSGREVDINEEGELCVKGPQVMQGYWQRPDETSLVFTADQYLKTGDIGHIDDQGYIYLVDRKKDMILVSGFNVYPNEVEQVIGMMPGVLEVGVIGVKSDIAGEKVKACIVKRDPALTEADVIKHCREHITSYKVPKIVEFFDELPKSNVGKILRKELR